MKITKPQIAGMLALASNPHDWGLIHTNTKHALLTRCLIARSLVTGGYIVTQHGIEQLRMRGHVAAVVTAEQYERKHCAGLAGIESPTSFAD